MKTDSKVPTEMKLILGVVVESIEDLISLRILRNSSTMSIE